MSERIGPQPGPQTAFLSSPADITIYGGAAGGGKSYALMLEPMRHLGVKGFGCVIFRRTLADVKKEGGLLDASMGIYGSIHGRLRQDTLTWIFPPYGVKTTFGHLEHETTVQDWQGAQIPLIGFDELTHFSRNQFFYLLSRNRSTCGVRPYVRATCNPDADSWVAELIAWWIDQDTGFPIPERSGIIRYMLRVNDELVFEDTREAMLKRFPDPRLKEAVKSITFIPSKVTDNAILMAKDPGYRGNLMLQNDVERGRLLDGNWKIRPSAGLYFKRNWVRTVKVIPEGTIFARGWDLAATAKKQGNDPDYTASTLIGKTPTGRYIVCDCTAMQEGSGEVENEVLRVTKLDNVDRHVIVAMFQDPAQAGKAQMLTYARLLDGYELRFKTGGKGDKIVRFAPFSSQAQNGNVDVLEGDWNERWFTNLEAFPDGKHDDIVDSTSEAYSQLLGAAFQNIPMVMPVVTVAPREMVPY